MTGTPTVHHDPARPEFGFSPSVPPSSRAWEARDRARTHRAGEAVHVADVATGVAPGSLDIASTYYRQAVAADVYADAVYTVEAAKVLAR